MPSGRPKGGKNKYWSKEEKLKILLQMEKEGIGIRTMNKKTGISFGQLHVWRKNYLEKGIEGLENSKKPGNPLVKYSSKKQLSETEKLEYENMKLRIELERLKKGYIVKGVGQEKEYISINSKSLK